MFAIDCLHASFSLFHGVGHCYNNKGWDRRLLELMPTQTRVLKRTRVLLRLIPFARAFHIANKVCHLLARYPSLVRHELKDTVGLLILLIRPSLHSETIACCPGIITTTNWLHRYIYYCLLNSATLPTCEAFAYEKPQPAQHNDIENSQQDGPQDHPSTTSKERTYDHSLDYANNRPQKAH